MTDTPDVSCSDPVCFNAGYHGKLPRIACLGADLSVSASVVLDEAQAHHVRHVLRLADGAAVRVFNAGSGEWLAALRHSGKRGALVEVTQWLRPPLVLPDTWLVAPPLKKDALDIMLEKASELGAARFVPVITDHTAVHRLNADRAQAQAVDAAAQCERCDVLQIDALKSLNDILAHWPQERTLYLALERSAAPALLHVLRETLPGAASAVLIGPEGGFSPGEREKLLALPFVTPVSLGATILRAETAAITALALVIAAQTA